MTDILDNIEHSPECEAFGCEAEPDAPCDCYRAEVVALVERVGELDARCEALQQQAEAHAMEAKTQRATVLECYRIVTDGTGEPGDWHGANPVRQRIAELERERDEAGFDNLMAEKARADALEAKLAAVEAFVSEMGDELENLRRGGENQECRDDSVAAIRKGLRAALADDAPASDMWCRCPRTKCYGGPAEACVRRAIDTPVDCWCWECADTQRRMTHMIVCPDCGNKRCPRATDHCHACTGSNEPGQPGSRYANPPETDDDQR